MLKDVLQAFNIDTEKYIIKKFGDGLINHTWKITDLDNNPEFILQQINKHVFKSPGDIADNVTKISTYLSYHQPNYLFVSPLPAAGGNYIIKYSDDEYYRVFPYVKNSVTVNAVQTPGEAFEAARQFARFTRLLKDFDSSELNYTLPGFHDLNTRYTQFQQAIQAGDSDRLDKAKSALDMANLYGDIAATYRDIVENQLIPLRVIHHDTKISNVLFDNDHKGLCVIDLDTVMPGYYISDIGDMMRTYLSPYSEEEQDLSKIEVRADFFEAIVHGYFSEMNDALTAAEKKLFVYSGKFMIYMQAIRFLTDYLNGDKYYHTSYPDHNLVRAQNQLVLLEKYIALEERFQQMVSNYA